MNATGKTAGTGFIVGAGRSGTTLLYKLLCLHPDVAFISNYENRLWWLPAGWPTRLAKVSMATRLEHWFRPGGDAYFRRRAPLARLVPMPVEGQRFMAACRMPLNPASGDVLPAATRRRFRRRVEAITRAAGASVFISKRTANNRRIPQLESVFPDARYVHLVRDGRDVSHSLSRVEWWNDHRLWWDGRTPRQLELHGEDRLAICARNWVREVEQLQQGLASVPESRVLETSYEQLVAHPQETIGGIIDFLNLSREPQFEAAIDTVKLRLRNRGWAREWSREDVETVMAEAGPTLSALGYAREPEPI